MSEMRFWYPASITQITSLNDSFDSCILRVCYAGTNRNQSYISKETIERAIPTMSYCPLVANYDVEADTIGGHDVDFVEGNGGALKMVNLTDAIGVVPENPQWCWERVIEDDGTEREYLSTPAILWKRTPVYEKIKRDGISGQSMEIRVDAGKMSDGVFVIEEFEFTAFCLLGDGVEPCFESAQISLFSVGTLHDRLGKMMDEFKMNFTRVMAALADDNKTPNGEESKLEGGECSLKMEELLEKYGLAMEDVNFDVEGLSADELDSRLAELKAEKFADEGGEEGGTGGDGQDGQDDTGDDQNSAGDQGENGDGQDEGDEDDNTDQDDDDDAPASAKRKYQLTGEQMYSEIMDALHVVMYTDEWGEWYRYAYVDYDPAVNEVYAYDNADWNLYGFKYSMNGDRVVIDFDSKTRKRIAFVDFDNGDVQFSYKHLMDGANAKFKAIADEVVSLRAYKLGVESEKRRALEDEVFNRFADLQDDERFKQLRENCGEMSIQDIEDKCFAIRGRNVQMKFSQGASPVRLPVEGNNHIPESDEPYNGVFVEYGVGI